MSKNTGNVSTVSKKSKKSTTDSKPKLKKANSVELPAAESKPKEKFKLENMTIDGVGFETLSALNEFSKQFEELKFLDMFTETSGIHWRGCSPAYIESQMSDKMKLLSYNKSKAFFHHISIVNRDYIIAFFTDDTANLINSLSKSKRLASFNF